MFIWFQSSILKLLRNHMQYFRKVNKCHKYMCLCAGCLNRYIWSQAERSQMNIMIYHASRFFHKQIFLMQIIAKLLCPQTQTGHKFQQICQMLIRKLKVLMASSCNYNSVGGPPLWSMLFEVKKGLRDFSFCSEWHFDACRIFYRVNQPHAGYL
jgi:hypothetical protein